jgi:hypothetical protein
MAHHLSQRSTVAMMLAFFWGLTAGLLAWGPVQWASTAVRFHGGPSVDLFQPGGIVFLFQPQLLIAGLLTAFAVWGQFLFVRCQRRAGDVVWPWRLLVVFAAVRACWWVAQTSATTDAQHTVMQLGAQLSQTGLAILLCWAWLADRFKVRGSGWSAVWVCAVVLSAAMLWWLVIPGAAAAPGGGDARALLLLQMMPFAMWAAGSLNLPERGLKRSKSLLMGGGYLLTWLATWAPSMWEFATGSQAQVLVAALPWISICALCVMMGAPLCSVFRAQQNGLIDTERAERRGRAPAWLHHFRFETLATPNRRSSS